MSCHQLLGRKNVKQVDNILSFSPGRDLPGKPSFPWTGLPYFDVFWPHGCNPPEFLRSCCPWGSFTHHPRHPLLFSQQQYWHQDASGQPGFIVVGAYSVQTSGFSTYLWKVFSSWYQHFPNWSLYPFYALSTTYCNSLSISVQPCVLWTESSVIWILPTTIWGCIQI